MIADFQTATVINICPQTDLAVIQLQEQIENLKKFAISRTIAKDEDISPATDDLSLIANVKKALTEKKAEYVKPIKLHLVNINEVFTDLETLLEEANIINRTKIKAYRDEQARRAAEIAEVNRQADELAKRQAALNGGEFTVNTTPIQAEPVVNKVSTDMGTVSTQKVWKYDIVNPALVPEEYKVIDYAKITKVVKAGCRSIPGIRIYCDETIRVNTK